MSEISAAALLVVVGEPFSSDHKDLILERITKGKCLLSLLYWNRLFEKTLFSRSVLQSTPHKQSTASGRLKKVWQQVMKNNALVMWDEHKSQIYVGFINSSHIFKCKNIFSKELSNEWMVGPVDRQRGSVEALVHQAASWFLNDAFMLFMANIFRCFSLSWKKTPKRNGTSFHFNA